MKYLIDVGHPAHIHYFKNFAESISKNNHKVLFTCRAKDITISLFNHYNFKFINFGHPFKSLIGKIFGLFYFTIKLLIISFRFKPDMFLNATMYSAMVSKLVRKYHISFEDTFNIEQVKLYLPFTNCVLTGNYKHPHLGRKEIQINGYQELLYLHPNHFKPDKSVLGELKVSDSEPFVIIRFVSWRASHDFGHSGISYENKISAIESFLKYARVFISSEDPLPSELENYRFPIAPHRMHHAMAFAALIYGESATMASEAAMLGVPNIYLHNTGTFYTQDLEKRYGLVFNYTESEDDQKLSIQKGIELLATAGIHERWQNKRIKMLAENIDVTAFLIWFVENYPISAKIMKKNPNYQLNFK